VYLKAYSLTTVLIIATASSTLAELPLPLRLPIFVWEMIFGILTGPHLLGLTQSIGRFTMSDNASELTRGWESADWRGCFSWRD
jgi:Kef-type K+ transport system membrane component KefB